MISGLGYFPKRSTKTANLKLLGGYDYEALGWRCSQMVICFVLFFFSVGFYV